MARFVGFDPSHNDRSAITGDLSVAAAAAAAAVAAAVQTGL